MKHGAKDVDESSDNYDTIEWLLKNIPHNNGRVGQWGISYPGWQTVMGMIAAHPALKASSPQSSPSDMFVGDDFHHNGAFRFHVHVQLAVRQCAPARGDADHRAPARVRLRHQRRLRLLPQRRHRRSASTSCTSTIRCRRGTTS